MDKYEKGIKELGITVNDYQIQVGTTKYPYEVVSFNSCDEMIRKIQRGISEYDWNHKGFDASDFRPNGSDHDWAFGQLKNYNKTLEYLSEGKVVDSVMAKAKKVYEDLVSQPAIEELMMRAATFKRKTVYSDEGAELCIDRVLCGDPAHWAKSTKGKKNTLIKLGVNLAGNAGESETMFNNITAVTGVVTDLLTRAGFAVQVDAISTGYGTTNFNNGRNYESIKVTLKNASEALDLQRIYSVGCSGFFRCWIFQVYTNILKGHPYSSLGQTRNVEKCMQEILDIDYVIDSSFQYAQSQSIKIEGMFNEIISHKI